MRGVEDDALGDLVKATDPDTGTTLSSYDDTGQLTSTTDAANQTLITDYDPLGRKTALHNGTATGPLLASWTYDPDGAKGQLASATAYAADGTTPTWTRTITGYNTAYQPTATTTTIPAGTYTNTTPISYTTDTVYLPISGNVYRTTISETGTGDLIPTESFGYSYNDAGLPVASGGLATYEAWTNYDPHGRILRATSGITPKQVVTTNSWDEPTGRLLGATVSKQDGDVPVTRTDYTYNPAGQTTSTTETRDQGGPALTDRQCYTYDYLGRLTNVWTDAGTVTTAGLPSVSGIGGCTTTDPTTATFSGPAPYWQSYTYDRTGNRTTRTDHATPGGLTATSTTTETYDGLATQHALHTATTGPTTATYTYDNDGRPTTTSTATNNTTDPDKTQRFTWTPSGRLASLTTGPTEQPTHDTTYGYDPDGNLAARTTDGTTTLYLGTDTITLTNNTTTEIDRTYTFPGGTTTVRVATTTGTTLHWQTTDPHGTGTTDITADTLTTTHRTFTPFGQQRTTGNTGPGWAGDKSFVGGTQDTTNNLTNLGAREYDPALGRFISPGPRGGLHRRAITEQLRVRRQRPNNQH